PLLLRKEPSRHLHPSAVQPDRRLGDVEGDAHREDPLLNGPINPFAFWSSAAPWLALLAFGLAVALLHARPHERTTYLTTLWFFLVGFAGEASASLVWALNFTDAAGTVHSLSRFVASIALIRLGGFTAFRLLLPLAGSRLPRIAEDLAIVGLYVVYGFVQLRAAGLDLSSLVTTSAILTAVIAFAMQDTL